MKKEILKKNEVKKAKLTQKTMEKEDEYGGKK